jgi:hypothetical protein
LEFLFLDGFFMMFYYLRPFLLLFLALLPKCHIISDVAFMAKVMVISCSLTGLGATLMVVHLSGANSTLPMLFDDADWQIDFLLSLYQTILQLRGGALHLGREARQDPGPGARGHAQLLGLARLAVSYCCYSRYSLDAIAVTLLNTNSGFAVSGTLTSSTTARPTEGRPNVTATHF